MTQDQIIESVGHAIGDMSEGKATIIRRHLRSVLRDIYNKMPEHPMFEDSDSDTSDSSRYEIELKPQVGELITVYTSEGDMNYITPAEFREMHQIDADVSSGSPSEYTVWDQKLLLNAKTDKTVYFDYYIKLDYAVAQPINYELSDLLFWGLIIRVLYPQSDSDIAIWNNAKVQYEGGIQAAKRNKKSSQQYNRIRTPQYLRDTINTRIGYRSVRTQ